MYRVLLGVVVLLTPIGALAQGAAAAAEKEVRAFIDTYNAAYGRNDLDAYFKAFAPDLTAVVPVGPRRSALVPGVVAEVHRRRQSAGEGGGP